MVNALQDIAPCDAPGCYTGQTYCLFTPINARYFTMRECVCFQMLHGCASVIPQLLAGVVMPDHCIY